MAPEMSPALAKSAAVPMPTSTTRAAVCCSGGDQAIDCARTRNSTGATTCTACRLQSRTRNGELLGVNRIGAGLFERRHRPLLGFLNCRPCRAPGHRSHRSAHADFLRWACPGLRACCITASLDCAIAAALARVTARNNRRVVSMVSHFTGTDAFSRTLKAVGRISSAIG